MKSRSVLLGFVLGTVLIVTMFGMAALVVAAIPKKSSFSLSSRSIAVIDVKDVITDSRDVLEQLNDYRDDGSVKAILVRIDSPGGAVGPSQEIYSELMKIRQEKIVVASLGSVAASGGYYIASAANLIVASPGTLTGSIGAIMEFMNLEELYRWAHVEYTTVKSGEFKDMGSSARPLTAKEKALLQENVNTVLNQFVQAVADGRQMSPDDIRPIADGRVLTGEQAMSLGLVDRMGNFNDAVDAAAEMAGITGTPKLIRARQKRSDVLDLFLDDLGGRLGHAFENARARSGARWSLR